MQNKCYIYTTPILEKWHEFKLGVFIGVFIWYSNTQNTIRIPR